MAAEQEAYDDEEFHEDDEDLIEMELENDQISISESAFIIGYEHKYEENDFWEIGD